MKKEYLVCGQDCENCPEFPGCVEGDEIDHDDLEYEFEADEMGYDSPDFDEEQYFADVMDQEFEDRISGYGEY